MRFDSRFEVLRETTFSGRVFLEKAVQEFEREMILDALRRTDYVQAHTSALLGISRRMLKYRMDMLSITWQTISHPTGAPEEAVSEAR